MSGKQEYKLNDVVPMLVKEELRQNAEIDGEMQRKGGMGDSAFSVKSARSGGYKTTGGGATSGGASYQKAGEDRGKCYRCGETGHRAADCDNDNGAIKKLQAQLKLAEDRLNCRIISH
jgi:hypothetical protein